MKIISRRNIIRSTVNEFRRHFTFEQKILSTLTFSKNLLKTFAFQWILLKNFFLRSTFFSLCRFENNIQMAVSLNLIYLLILTFPSESVTTDEVIFSKNLSISSSSSTFLASVSVHSELRCASECAKKSHCNNFYFNPNNKTCFLQVKTFLCELIICLRDTGWSCG